MAIWMASLAGVPYLTWQLRRLGLSDENESTKDARTLLPLIAATVEEARRDA